MDLTATEPQQFILDAVAKLLDRNGGARRAMELLEDAAYDAPLDGELDAAGFGNLALESGTGPLEAGNPGDPRRNMAFSVAAGATEIQLDQVAIGLLGLPRVK